MYAPKLRALTRTRRSPGRLAPGELGPSRTTKPTPIRARTTPSTLRNRARSRRSATPNSRPHTGAVATMRAALEPLVRLRPPM
ncbi:hypothetical protein BH24ACT18_BH24ACT18_09300 [soil metagenome]